MHTEASGNALPAPQSTRRLVEHSHPAARALLDPVSVDRPGARRSRPPATGRTNTEFSRAPVLSQGAVRTHVEHLLTKRAPGERVHVAIEAYGTGVGPPRTTPTGPP